MNQHRVIRPESLAFQRTTMRHKLFEPVSMRVDGVSMRAHLLDLSRSGELAHAERDVAPGGHVQLEGIGILTPARIIWVRDRRFGLRFDNWLSEELVAMIVGLAISPDATSSTG